MMPALLLLAIAILFCVLGSRGLAQEQQLGGATGDPRHCMQANRVAADATSSAIRCAEAFIADNGYTQRPPDASRLVMESIEWESGEAMLMHRKGSLEAKGYGICETAKGNARGWTVVFRYANAASDTAGRAVTMAPDFSQMRVEHKDFILAALSGGLSGCRVLKPLGPAAESGP